MYLRKEKGRFWKWTGIFFALMLIFTLLSRAVYQSGITVVTTAEPSNGTIDHNVNLSGKTIQNQELAVTTVGNLRIASVQVNEGQQVKKGDVLFTLDLDYLAETILHQQQEMEKQKLSIQDAWSQSNASARQRNNAQAQAAENYDSAVTRAQVTLDRAKRDLDRAKAALETFYSGVSADQADEELLAAACQDAKADYDAAVLAQENLAQEINRAVQEAIDQAESAILESQTTIPTKPTEEAASDEATDSTETTEAAEVPSVVSVEPRSLTQEEKDQIEASVRAEYAVRVAEAEAAVAEAKEAMDSANAELTVFRQEKSSTPARSEEDLKLAVERAQEAYDDAVAGLENAKTVYGRAIESAELPGSTNSSAQIGQITYDQMNLTLGKYTALQEANGQILAPVDGIVTSCFVQTGEKTTESTAVLLADLDQGCKFFGLVSDEQSPYIGVGDKVTIRAGNTGKLYKDLPVTTFSTTEEVGGGYRITVQLPAGSLSLGASAELLFTKKSQPYPTCVPLSALRLDARNQPFVLVAEEVNTVLGTQLQAKKVSVTVLDQNETMAALAEGVVSPQDQIIIGSDKAVEPGTRIRVG